MTCPDLCTAAKCAELLDLPRDKTGGGATIEIPPTTVAINGNYDPHNNNLNLSVTVNGVSSAFSINLDEMPFESILDCLEIIKTTLEAEKELETITIITAPEVQTKVTGTILVLDFTTVAAFPNLNETKSKWRVQIPAPIENITWDTLKDIRWFRGSQYARMSFTSKTNHVSGWFRSILNGNAYFDQITQDKVQWKVRLTPIDLPHVKGVEGNFYRIFPFTVTTDKGTIRSDLGIHKDANVPGSMGCIVLTSDRFRSFEAKMSRLKDLGIRELPLFVTYS